MHGFCTRQRDLRAHFGARSDIRIWLSQSFALFRVVLTNAAPSPSSNPTPFPPFPTKHDQPHGSTRKYRSSCFIDTGRQKSEGSTAAVSATDVLESLRERGSGSEKVLTIGGGLNSGGDTVGTGPADRSCRSGNAIGAGASDGGTGLLTNTATGGSVGGPGLGLATVRTGGAGGGKNSNNLSLACGGDHTTWSLDELVDSFETDRFPRKWRRGCGVMNDNVNGAFTLLRGGLRRESGGPSDWSGGGTGGSEGRSSGPLRGAAPPEAAASWRTEREMRTLQVQFMRERMVQLRRAVEEGQLRPLGNRFFQVGQVPAMRRWTSSRLFHQKSALLLTGFVESIVET